MTNDIRGSSAPNFVPLTFERHSVAESARRAAAFYDAMNRRRTMRHFSTEPIPRDLIETAIRTAGTAPGGAAPAAVDVRRGIGPIAQDAHQGRSRR